MKTKNLITALFILLITFQNFAQDKPVKKDSTDLKSNYNSSLFKPKSNKPNNYFASNYITEESAYGLEKGQLNFRYHNFVFNEFQYGITDRLTASVSYNLGNLFTQRQKEFNFGLKYSIPLINNRLQWGIKVLSKTHLFGYIYGNEPFYVESDKYQYFKYSGTDLATYFTIGNKNNNVTLGYKLSLYNGRYNNRIRTFHNLYINSKTQIFNNTSLLIDMQLQYRDNGFNLSTGIGGNTYLFDRLSILYGAKFYLNMSRYRTAHSYNSGDNAWFPYAGLNYRFK